MLAEAIERSCASKAKVVAADEREGGIRAILNLGHTFGHAIETAQGYGEWLHGEAVAAGMVLALQLSVKMGAIQIEAVEQLEKLLQKADLPIRPPQDMSSEQFLKLMSVDKKVLDGKLRLVVLDAIGQARVTSEIKTEDVIAVIEEATLA